MSTIITHFEKKDVESCFRLKILGLFLGCGQNRPTFEELGHLNLCHKRIKVVQKANEDQVSESDMYQIK